LSFDVNITIKKVNEKNPLEALGIVRFLLTKKLFVDMEKAGRSCLFIF